MATFEPETTFGSNAHRSMQLYCQLHKAESNLNDVRARSWRRQRVNDPAYKAYLEAKLACANDTIRHYEDTVCAESGGFSGYRSSIGSSAWSITSGSQAKRNSLGDRSSSSTDRSAREARFPSAGLQSSPELSGLSLSPSGTWTDDALQDMDALIRNAVVQASKVEINDTSVRYLWQIDLLSGLNNILTLHVDRLACGSEETQRNTMAKVLYQTMAEDLPHTIDAAIYELWGDSVVSQVVRAYMSEVVDEWHSANADTWNTTGRCESIHDSQEFPSTRVSDTTDSVSRRTLGLHGAIFGGSAAVDAGLTSSKEVSNLIDAPSDTMSVDWDTFADTLRGRQLVQDESGLFYPRCRSHIESPPHSPSGFRLPLNSSFGTNMRRVEFAIDDRRPPREPIQCLVPVRPIQCRLLHIAARDITMDRVFWAMTQHLDPEYVLRIAEFVVGLHCEGTPHNLNWEEDQECWERLNQVLEELNFDIVWTDGDGDTEMEGF